MKVSAISSILHASLQTRARYESEQCDKFDDRVKTVRADNVQAYHTVTYQKEANTVWLQQHSRTGGSVDILA